MKFTIRHFQLLALVVAITLTLLAIVLHFHWRAIEQELEASANHALDRAGLNWATAHTYNRGRDIAIQGSAPNPQSIDQALESTKAVFGVRTAEFFGDLFTQDQEQAVNLAPSLILSVQQGSIALSGHVSDKTEIDALLNAANVAFGPSNTLNQLELRSGDALNQSFADTLPVLQSAKFEQVQHPSTLSGIKLDGNVLTVFGLMSSERERDNLLEQLESVFDGQVVSEIALFTLESDKSLEVLKSKETDICIQEINELIASTSINFELGKSALPSSSYPIFETVTVAVKRCPAVSLLVEGHTDNTGNIKQNKQLSLERADAVKAFLVERGVSDQRLTTQGYGASRPLATNTTEEGRMLNRRIEFKLATQASDQLNEN